MDSLFWITLGISIIGFVVLALIKRNMESKKSSTIQSLVWFIVGTTVWGVASMILLVLEWKFK